ncbi:MAG: GNAT family N-acetyltransferase [Vicinamibacteria bacterium]
MDPTNRSTTGTDIDARNYRQQEHLLDGRTVVLRAIRPEDKRALATGFRRLSPQSVYFRFFQAKQDLDEEELRYLTELDFETHVALVAILEERELRLPIGVGRYILEEEGRAAEIAFVVDEGHHGLGVATLLLEHLARIARSKRLEEFRAYVLAENRAMLEVFERAGFPMERRLEGNVIVVSLALS